MDVFDGSASVQPEAVPRSTIKLVEEAKTTCANTSVKSGDALHIDSTGHMKSDVDQLLPPADHSYEIFLSYHQAQKDFAKQLAMAIENDLNMDVYFHEHDGVRSSMDAAFRSVVRDIDQLRVYSSKNTYPSSLKYRHALRIAGASQLVVCILSKESFSSAVLNIELLLNLIAIRRLDQEWLGPRFNQNLAILPLVYDLDRLEFYCKSQDYMFDRKAWSRRQELPGLTTIMHKGAIRSVVPHDYRYMREYEAALIEIRRMHNLYLIRQGEAPMAESIAEVYRIICNHLRRPRKADFKDVTSNPARSFDFLGYIDYGQLAVADACPYSCVGEHSTVVVRLPLWSGMSDIFVIVSYIHQSSSENMEFLFYNEREMAACGGVGLPHSKVVLDGADLSISVCQMDEQEWKKQTNNLLKCCCWKNRGDLEIMDYVQATQEESGIKSADMKLDGVEMSEIYGVGFQGEHRIYVNYEKPDEEVVMLPLLYDMALFVLQKLRHKQCNNEASSSSTTNQGIGSSQDASADNSLMQKLSKKCGHPQGNANEEEGDGGEDGEEEHLKVIPIEEADDPMEILRVTVYPRAQSYFFQPGKSKTVRSWRGLDSASISIEMLLIFKKFSLKRREISIKVRSTLEVNTGRNVYQSANTFGWYHRLIDISLGCVDEAGNQNLKMMGENTLRHESNRVYGSEETRLKLSSTDATTSSKGCTAAIGGDLDLRFGKLNVNGSKDTNEATSRSDTIEIPMDCICKGFLVSDNSNESRAKFRLCYPLDEESMWDRKDVLRSRGLCSTIFPCIEGTWINLDESTASPYILSIERDIKLHERTANDKVDISECTQEYMLLFFLNNAMTHLRRKEGQDVRLISDKQKVELSQVLHVCNLTDDL